MTCSGSAVRIYDIRRGPKQWNFQIEGRISSPASTVASLPQFALLPPPALFRTQGAVRWLKRLEISFKARLLLSIPLYRLTMAMPLLVLLGACSGSQNALEDRVISVESDAIPTAATPTPDLSDILKQTSPSYVTITIAEARRKGRPGD